MKALQERVAPASVEAVGEIVGACDRAGEKVSIVAGNTLRRHEPSARARRRNARRDVAAGRRSQRARRSHARGTSGNAAARRGDAARRARNVRAVRRAAAVLRNRRRYAGRGMGRPTPAPLRTGARLSHRIDHRPRRRNGRARRRHGREERRWLRHEPALRRLVRHSRGVGASELQNDTPSAARAMLSRAASGANAWTRRGAARRSCNSALGGIRRARIRQRR